MRKLSTLLLSLSLAAMPFSAFAFEAGEYTASAQGMDGPVTVTATFDESGITDVSVDVSGETAGIGAEIADEVQKQILEAQSAEIDGVAGATVSSQAVAAAVADLIAQASGEAGDADAPISFTEGTYTATTDGYNGPVTFGVTFSADALTDVTVTESAETAHVGTPAYEIVIPAMIEANGTGVDGLSGATFTTRAIREAVNDAAKQAGCTNLDAFMKNTVEVVAQDPIEETYDVVIVGAGGAGISAAAQAAQDGNTVLLIEKNAEVGGNTLVSGGQYQSVMPYLVWDPADPDAETGVGYDGQTYNKVKSVQGCIDELKMILNWSEEPFDEEFYVENEFVAGDALELSKHGVHEDYLPVLQALKEEIQTYLDWAQPQLDAGTPENQLTLFSTLNLHIFQTYYGGLRQSADKSEWIYGDVDLVKQFIEDGQDLKPWLESMGSTFIEDTQPTLIGALWYRENEFIGANVDTDGDGETEEYGGRWGTYFMAPMTSFLQANEANKVMTRTTATGLIEEDGRVTGVKAMMYDGTEVTAHANKGVILCTGGYAANIDMVLDYNIYWSEEYLSKAT